MPAMKYGDAEDTAKKESRPLSTAGATAPARVQTPQKRMQLR